MHSLTNAAREQAVRQSVYLLLQLTVSKLLSGFEKAQCQMILRVGAGFIEKLTDIPRQGLRLDTAPAFGIAAHTIPRHFVHTHTLRYVKVIPNTLGCGFLMTNNGLPRLSLERPMVVSALNGLLASDEASKSPTGMPMPS